jgi:hypothetical protein
MVSPKDIGCAESGHMEPDHQMPAFTFWICAVSNLSEPQHSPPGNRIHFAGCVEIRCQ